MMAIAGRRAKRIPQDRLKTTGAAQLIGVRIHRSLLEALDAFIKEHDEHPSRPEAVRMILADALTSYGLLPAPSDADGNGA